ncbi:hypothetical protein CLV54_2577 [Compostimonas suwonensis]|uniref:Transmembrane protein n=2 Tax=Compostimonas suwonensis TaxID=1048394 RepID=A0A2M9BUL4_9MICO|nr:hypothetical protein CLV54_2577 [Compostimonas suwonensis]
MPAWVVSHALLLGIVWNVFWLLVLLLAELWDWSSWAWYAVALVSVLPCFVATIVVLKATPRTHLHEEESILTHFLVRFVGFILAFCAWVSSIVIGASISSVIQLTVDNDEKEVVGLGFQLVIAALPLVVTLLWLAFIIRCAWFLSRLRGWRAHPVNSRVPEKLFRDWPGLRSVSISLANPGLLLGGGFVTTVVIVAVISLDFSLTILF